jgi:hypothetical protein
MISIGTVAFCVATGFGMGEHIYLLDMKNIPNILRCHYLVAASYNCSTALIKISLLLQYLRIFERGTWTYRLTQLLLITIAAWGCVFAFLAWFPCLPDPSSFWRMTQEGCYAAGSPDTNVVISWVLAHAGSNLGFDILVLMLAFRLAYRLAVSEGIQTPKAGLMFLLSMGILSVSHAPPLLRLFKSSTVKLTSILRSCVFAIWRLAGMITSRAGMDSDLTWNLPGPTLLSFSEIYIAALTASIPFFWPIITKQFTKIFIQYEFDVTTEPRYRLHDFDPNTGRKTQSDTG